MDLLVFLAAHRGKVLSKDELTEGVWGKEFVSDGTLTHAIAVLRQTLGDDPRNPSYIETIPTRGYRLIAAAEAVGAAEAAEDLPEAAPQPSSRRRIRVALLALAGAAIAVILGMVLRPLILGGGPASSRGDRIAVLPFRNVGAADREFLASGITDDLTTRLASVTGLVVVSRISADSATRTARTARAIGSELGADYLLVGSVRWEPEPRGEGEVWVNAQLVRAANDAYVWVGRYHRPMANVFEIETNIAAQVLAELGMSVTTPELAGVHERPTNDIDAYQAYLCAVRHQRFDTPAHLGLAAAMLERAVQLDSSFALAYADLSVVHSRIFWLRVDHTEGRLARAKAAVDRALALQPDLPAAHRALGAYELFGFRDYERALAEFRRAAQALPHDSELAAMIADVHRREGRWHEATEELQHAWAADPRNYELALELGDTLSRMRDYPGADRAYQSAARMMPDSVKPYLGRFWNAVRWYGMSDRTADLLKEVPQPEAQAEVFERYFVRLARRDYPSSLTVARAAPAPFTVTPSLVAPVSLLECLALYSAGDRAQADARCRTALQILSERAGDRDDPRVKLATGYALAVLGRRDEARHEVDEAVRSCPVETDAYDGATYLAEAARVLAVAGAADEALADLEQVLALPSPDSVESVRADPRFDALAGDPRFAATLARSRP
jgi:TolB-like protein/DNA-binding winged helix-turn-helix (wHTH) protein/Flp pilus assembly protein TadD